MGECRGGEALDMLQAMNTGHDGSLTTAHVNTARDMLSRLEVMVLMAGMDLPLTAIREQIASAVDVIVQITRFSCGSRKVTSICEVTGTESGTIQLQELFSFKQQGYDAAGKVKGVFRTTGAIPEFYEEMRERGLPADLSIEAFADFKEKTRDNSGQWVEAIPNDYLGYRQTSLGASSGLNIQDATLLQIRVTYVHPRVMPFPAVTV
ncbi:ATPase, T2SS/T4P/T4SS family [Acidithiobacillus sp.]